MNFEWKMGCFYITVIKQNKTLISWFCNKINRCPNRTKDLDYSEKFIELGRLALLSLEFGILDGLI